MYTVYLICIYFLSSLFTPCVLFCIAAGTLQNVPRKVKSEDLWIFTGYTHRAKHTLYKYTYISKMKEKVSLCYFHLYTIP